jgi:hypothetical protein
MDKKLISTIFILFCIFISTAYSAPMIWGIALNHDTKECAGFWGGDEFILYYLPTNWAEYYVNYVNYTGPDIIKTDVGSCNFSKGAEECCNQLGYTFVSNQIGIKDSTSCVGLGGIVYRDGEREKLITGCIESVNHKQCSDNYQFRTCSAGSWYGMSQCYASEACQEPGIAVVLPGIDTSDYGKLIGLVVVLVALILLGYMVGHKSPK